MVCPESEALSDGDLPFSPEEEEREDREEEEKATALMSVAGPRGAADGMDSLLAGLFSSKPTSPQAGLGLPFASAPQPGSPPGLLGSLSGLSSLAGLDNGDLAAIASGNSTVDVTGWDPPRCR